LLTAGNNAVNQQTYTTAAISPAANALITVAVMGHNSSSAVPSPVLTGGGMSAWTEVATVTFATIALPHTRLTIFRALSATPGSGPITITFTNSVSHAQWIVSQWESVETSGVNGAGAIAQTGVNNGDGVSGLTVSLAPFGDAHNAAYGVFGVSSNAAVVTPAAGFTEISEQPSAEGTPSDLQAQWATNVNTIAATWTSLNGAAVGVEIKAANTGPVEPVASVGVTPASATVESNQTVQLTATLRDAAGNPLSGRVVTWTSSNTAAATVSASGLVTGKAAGSATITATSEGQSGTSAITVSAPVPVATVEVTPASATVDEGKTVQLTATLRDAAGNPLSGRVVTWTSDNTTAATVSANGLVTAKTAGSATITATSEGQSGTSAITVVRVPVASVSVAPASASVQVGSSVQLTATPKDASGAPLPGRTITWSSDNTAIATVSGSGLVSGVAEGGVAITATSEGQSGSAAITVTPAPPPGSGVVFVGAGDIANCSTITDEATAQLLDAIAGTVWTAGDNVYTSGTATEFATCYEPTWGRHKARTRPSPGNHDYNTSGATGYYNYFGANAGPSGRGYYSYDLGDWHIISLNSEVSTSPGSAQEVWLRADLAANTKQCTLAYWHKPLFSSGYHGNLSVSKPLWAALYEYNAEFVIVGHDHNYERFAPQTADGVVDLARGLREFVVGTGGTSLRSVGTPIVNSEVVNSNTHGVMKFTLRAGGYDWEFIPIAGKTFTDRGSGTCH
jgi:uncharacterized protein YjdB